MIPLKNAGQVGGIAVACSIGGAYLNVLYLTQSRPELSAPSNKGTQNAQQLKAQEIEALNSGFDNTASFVAYQTAIKQLQSLPLVYNKPSTLEFDRYISVSAILVTTRAGVPNALADISKNEGQKISDTVKVGDSVTAELSGGPEDVEIDPKGPVQHAVTPLENISWQWQVRAKRPFKTTITLNVSTNLKVGGVEKDVQVRTYHVDMPVHTTIFGEAKYWSNEISPIWVLGGGIFGATIGLSAWLWPRRPGGPTATKRKDVRGAAAEAGRSSPARDGQHSPHGRSIRTNSSIQEPPRADKYRTEARVQDINPARREAERPREGS